MAAASSNKFPKIFLEEVANDGSATPTPAADHRALFLGEDGLLHLKDAADAVTDVGGVGASALVGDRVVRTAGDLTTTSTSLVDATGMSITLTTGAHKCLVGVVAEVFHNSNNARVILDIDIDGSNLGGTNGLSHEYTVTGGTDVHNASFTHMTDALTAASHTFKLRWKVAAGTGNLLAGTTSPLVLWVAEMPF